MYFYFNTKNIQEQIPQMYLAALSKNINQNSFMYHIKRTQYLANYLQMSIIFPCMAFTVQKIRRIIGGLPFRSEARRALLLA